MTPQDKIKDLLAAAHINDEEMSVWTMVLKTLPEPTHQDILEALTDHPDGVGMLTNNLMAKMKAVEAGDLQQWEQVLDQEKSIIEEF